jgi:hypothetical protein
MIADGLHDGRGYDKGIRQISDYSCRLNVNEDNPEKKVAEFINFLPVLAYDGSTMKQISAQDVLDIALAGTSATLLARRRESALLVNVDNDTLLRLLANKQALDALMKIEGLGSLPDAFRTCNNQIEPAVLGFLGLGANLRDSASFLSKIA